MTPVKRRVAAVSVPLLLAVSLSACGSDGGGSDAPAAPDNASTDTFCQTYLDASESLNTDDTDEAVDAAHQLADQLAETGTPEDMSDAERNGFEKFVEFLGGVDSGDVDDLEGQDVADVFGDDAGDVEAFLTYIGSSCVPDLPTDLPS